MEIQSQRQNQLKLQPKSSNPSVSKGSKFKGRNNNKVNKFVGVRQRPSGRWVAEIKNTAHKIRMWLGTFETAEEAARAYDEAACLLHGSNTRTNFITQAPSDSPLAYRIRNLLDSKKGGEQQHHQSVVVSAAPSTSATISFSPMPCPSTSSSGCSSNGGLSNGNLSVSGTVQDTQLFDDVYKPDTRSWRRESGFDSDFTYTSSEIGFDRFLYTQETTGLPEETGSELTEFQSMKVERQISASLHAMNGVEECMETVHDSSENLWDLPPLCSLLY